jgi:CheY-like chemotaxis protein
MPGGGEIVIGLSTVDGRVLASRYPAADRQRYVCASVRDTGTGMDKETKARAFDPFFTTKEKGKGTGLGLSVVYGIIQNHQGFVEVESRIDHGSVFSLYLPVDEHTGLMETDVSRSVEIPRGSETILVVEDEPLLQDLMRSRFETKGYRVLVANDGLHAVDLYSHHKSEIAVVFSDMGLPKLTGENVFRKLKELNPAVQVVFASGFLEPELKTEMLKNGVKAFVQKPYEPDEVLVLIRRLLDGD